MASFPLPPAWVSYALRDGLAIPAHPLALTSRRRLDERRQRGLTRYYHAAGAGGVAVGVHTTQFAIRDPQHSLLAPVLQLAAETVAECDAATGRQTVRIAGICGSTRQARAETALARSFGYHAGLLSLAALKQASDDTLLEHCRAIAEEIPLFGFYLQPAVGGRVLTFNFWRRFAEIPNVVAIKIAPFDRYRTIEVVRAVAEAGRAGDIALYTGNDDQIVLDLLTEFAVPTVAPKATGSESSGLGVVRLRMVGGLLGQWACWTRSAVELLAQCKRLRARRTIPAHLFTLAAQLTDANAAIFDAVHAFAGCLPGIHEILRRQGLLANTLCLDPNERLSPGQASAIARVCRAYPHLADDAFVRQNLDDWLRP